MGWRNLVVTKHCKMSYSGRRVIIQTSQEVNQILIDDLDVILIDTDQAVITSKLIAELSKAGIKIIFIDEHGMPISETISYVSMGQPVSLIKDQIHFNQERKESLWTKVVTTKMSMQINLLELLGKDNQALVYDFNKIEFNDVTNREAVIANKYFKSLFNQNFKRHEFNPYNAALNYGYSILLSHISKEIVLNGYATQFGIHHHNNENKYNFSSDLMEPFRPIIDLWVSQHEIKELTHEIKIQIMDLINYELIFNGKETTLRNAIKKFVRECLEYLSDLKHEYNFKIEVKK